MTGAERILQEGNRAARLAGRLLGVRSTEMPLSPLRAKHMPMNLLPKNCPLVIKRLLDLAGTNFRVANGSGLRWLEQSFAIRQS